LIILLEILDFYRFMFFLLLGGGLYVVRLILHLLFSTLLRVPFVSHMIDWLVRLDKLVCNIYQTRFDLYLYSPTSLTFPKLGQEISVYGFEYLLFLGVDREYHNIDAINEVLWDNHRKQHQLYLVQLQDKDSAELHHDKK